MNEPARPLRPETPELDKLTRLQDSWDVLESFLVYLPSKGMTIMRRHLHDSRCHSADVGTRSPLETRVCGKTQGELEMVTDTVTLLARYLDIDLQKVRDERKLLEAFERGPDA